MNPEEICIETEEKAAPKTLWFLVQPVLAGIMFLIFPHNGHYFISLTLCYWGAAALVAAARLFLNKTADQPIPISKVFLKYSYPYGMNIAAAALLVKVLMLDFAWCALVPAAVAVAGHVISLVKKTEPQADSLQNTVLKWLFIISLSFSAGCLTRQIEGRTGDAFISIYLTALIFGFIFYFADIDKLFKAMRRHTVKFWLFTFSLSAAMSVLLVFSSTSPLVNLVTRFDIPTYNELLYVISYLSIFVMLILVTAFVSHHALPMIKRFTVQVDKFEKLYLCIGSVLYVVLILFIAYNTNAFSMPMFNEFSYDNIFTSDTRLLLQGYYNAFSNVNSGENDIRQMLFGLLGLPFATVSYVAAFIANAVSASFGLKGYFWYYFSVALMLVQAGLVLLISVMIRRILKTMVISPFAEFFMLIFAFSYSTVVFSLVVEQYIIGLFYLITAVYVLVCDYSENRAALGISCAAGSMMPSASAFLMVFSVKPRPNWRGYVSVTLKTIGMFALICLMFGQIGQILSMWDGVMYTVNGFGGVNLSFMDKFWQYIEAISNMLLSPVLTTEEVYNGAMGIRPVHGLMFEMVCGCVILALAIVGFAVNIKKPAAKMSFYWVIISFAVLVLVGWGAPENGMILYTSYFFWAFLILIAGLFNFVFKRIPRVGAVVMFAMVTVLAAYNVVYVTELINMSIQYYPMRFI